MYKNPNILNEVWIGNLWRLCNIPAASFVALPSYHLSARVYLQYAYACNTFSLQDIDESQGSSQIQDEADVGKWFYVSLRWLIGTACYGPTCNK